MSATRPGQRRLLTCDRLVFVVFAALLLLAQQEATVHALGHLPELLAASQPSDQDDESAPHKCPDCARFASFAVGAPPVDGAALHSAQRVEQPVHAVVAAIENPPLARPRNRSPPQA